MKEPLTFRFLAEPTDVNFGGKVHGGAVMKWIDQAGYASAVNWCGGYAVTIYVGGIRFYNPIHIGYLVEIRTRIIYTAKTSMHIAVDVYSKALEANDFIHNTHCVIIFVALDAEGKTKPVPAFIPQTDEEKRMEIYAKKLMELRQGIEKEMQPFLLKN